MNEPTNADLYGVLLTIKEDIGGLKTSSGLQLKALENHSNRITVLEDTAAKQKGAIKAWGTIATTLAGLAATLAGALHFRN